MTSGTLPSWLTEEFLQVDLRKLCRGMAWQFRKVHFAEDIYQESVMRLLEKAQGYDQPRGTVKAWARVVIKTEIIPRFNRMSYDLDYTCHDFRISPETKMQSAVQYKQEQDARELVTEESFLDAKVLLSTMRDALRETLSEEDTELAIEFCLADDVLAFRKSIKSKKTLNRLREGLATLRDNVILREWAGRAVA